MFMGNVEEEQIWKIFSLLGTPTEASWPGVGRLEGFNRKTFPGFVGQDLGLVVLGLDDAGLGLLRRLLRVCPAQRTTAGLAAQDAWFADVYVHGWVNR